jgi:hypothetical protein
MHIDDTLDYCHGCAESPQVNLSNDWIEGDILPDNVTVHCTKRDPRKFVFIGPKERQKRLYL